MQSRISVNVHGQNVPDIDYLKGFLVKLNPAWVLIMDNIGLAKDIKAMLPETNVICRNWGADGDDNDHKQYTPGQWIAEKLRERGAADLWFYTTNEPEFSDEVVRWHVDVMKLAANAGLKLVVGNWGVGIPADVDHDWARAETMLRLLNQHRETMALGLHEYACGVITSGFVGGPPTELRDASGNLLHPDFIQPENWPDDVSKIGALWHCGRFRFLERYCQSIGLRPPRIVVTEHGFDDVSDIKSWTETLIKTNTPGNPGGNIRGWKTLENQWNAWFGSRKWSPQRAYFEQLKYADQKIYRGSAVEGQLIFSWGHSSDAWAQFDIADAQDLHGLLRDYEEVTPPSEQEGERLPAFPADFGERAVPARLLPVGNSLRIRLKPTTSAAILVVIPDGGVDGAYIPEDALREDEVILDTADGANGIWIPVRTGEISGWVFGGLLRVEEMLPLTFDRQLVTALIDSLQAGVDELRRYFDQLAED